MKRSASKDLLRCSFCHKNENLVGTLISNQYDNPRAYICDECVEGCYAILHGEGSGHPAISFDPQAFPPGSGS